MASVGLLKNEMKMYKHYFFLVKNLVDSKFIAEIVLFVFVNTCQMGASLLSFFAY